MYSPASSDRPLPVGLGGGGVKGQGLVGLESESCAGRGEEPCTGLNALEHVSTLPLVGDMDDKASCGG